MMYAGIDLGGTAIKAGLVTENGKIAARGVSETKAGRPVEELIRDMASCLEKTAEKAGLSMREIQSVGIGIPGFADNRSGTGFACDNLSPDPIPFRDEFRKNLDIPVSLIAMEMGYDNFSHFTHIFKKICGTTPSDYRKEIRDQR